MYTLFPVDFSLSYGRKSSSFLVDIGNMTVGFREVGILFKG